MEKFVFLKAEEADMAKTAELYREVSVPPFCTWNEYYPSDEDINSDMSAGTLFLLKDGESIAAAASIVPQNELDGCDFWTEAYAAEIARVAVKPQYQGKSLALSLLSRIENILAFDGFNAVHLLAAKINTPACKTYIRAGYRVCGEVFMYGNDYYAMEKILDRRYIKTERLVLYPISDAALQKAAEDEYDENMKGAYCEMLAGCKAHPFDRIWYTDWNIDANGETVGDFCFKGIQNGVVEIGYGLREGCCKKGYMTEAVRAAVKWAFENGALCVRAETDKDNTASQKVLAAASFVPTGTLGSEGPIFEFKPLPSLK